MPRFYIPPSQWHLGNLEIEGGEAHHCLHVLRMQPGDRATVFNGQGMEATVELASIKRERIELKVIDRSTTPPMACHITLAQGIPKGKTIELIIEKATELGAAALVPLLSERTILQISPGDSVRKQEKWERVAVEAAKQCGQNWLPRVDLPQTPKAFFDAAPSFDLMLIASLQPEALHLKNVLLECKGRPLARILMMVGPEGDFTPAELALARSRGCRPITLGPIILRSETAAFYCLSVLSHELFSQRNGRPRLT